MVLHVKSGMSPSSPTRSQGGQAAPRGASQAQSTLHRMQPCLLIPLWHSWQGRTLRRDTGSGSPAARPGCSLETLLLPSSGLKNSSSSTSMSHLKTSTVKAFSDRVKHEMKHLPPSTVTVRRRERARNPEGILGKRERRVRKDAFSKKPLGGCQCN